MDEQLLKPTTELERAELSLACKMTLNDQGQMVLRRVLFERDQLEASLMSVLAAYDHYRGRGVTPAPDAYQKLSQTIDVEARATLRRPR